MNSQIVDVMILTKTALAEAEFSEIARQVKAIGGVDRFDQHSRINSLIMVRYQAEKIKAIQIINEMSRMGYNASLVGI